MQVPSPVPTALQVPPMSPLPRPPSGSGPQGTSRQVPASPASWQISLASGQSALVAHGRSQKRCSLPLGPRTARRGASSRQSRGQRQSRLRAQGENSSASAACGLLPVQTVLSGGPPEVPPVVALPPPVVENPPSPSSTVVQAKAPARAQIP